MEPDASRAWQCPVVSLYERIQVSLYDGEQMTCRSSDVGMLPRSDDPPSGTRVHAGRVVRKRHDGCEPTLGWNIDDEAGHVRVLSGRGSEPIVDGGER